MLELDQLQLPVVRQCAIAVSSNGSVVHRACTKPVVETMQGLYKMIDNLQGLASSSEYTIYTILSDTNSVDVFLTTTKNSTVVNQAMPKDMLMAMLSN